MPTTQETDGFQVKRPGDLNVKCTLLLMLDHQVTNALQPCLGSQGFIWGTGAGSYGEPFLCLPYPSAFLKNPA